MSRTEAREQAFVFLFEKLFNPELSFDELCALAAQSRVFEPDLYTRDIFEKTVENIETTDLVINSYAKKWRTARMPKVTLCILRLAVTETKRLSLQKSMRLPMTHSSSTAFSVRL